MPYPTVLLHVVASLILLGEGVLLLRRIFWTPTPKPVSETSSDKETAHYQATRETRAIATETRDLVRALEKANILEEARAEEHSRIMSDLRTSIENNTAVVHELLAVIKTLRR